MSGNRLDRVAQRAEGHVASGAFSGIEWAVTQGGAPFCEGRAGLANALSGREMAEVPIYRIYSMTKPIVSAVAMMLVEEGKLRLIDPVAAYLPKFAGMKVVEGGAERAPRTMMTVEHCLSHRAGLSYSFLHGSCDVAKRMVGEDLFAENYSLEEICDRLVAYGLAFDPGTSWNYSTGTDVIGRIIEIIEGKPLQDVLAERVFRPLGLSDTGFSVAPSEQHRVMSMFGTANIDNLFDFESGPQKLTPVDSIEAGYPLNNPNYARGGLGLYSTLPDYMKVARFLSDGLAQGNVLLGRKAVEMLWADRIPDTQKPMMLGPVALWGYGYSLAGRCMSEPRLAMGFSSAGEIGWAGAASTYFWIDPVEDLIGVVMAQYLGSKVPLGDDMRNAVYQALD